MGLVSQLRGRKKKLCRSLVAVQIRVMEKKEKYDMCLPTKLNLDLLIQLISNLNSFDVGKGCLFLLPLLNALVLSCQEVLTTSRKFTKGFRNTPIVPAGLFWDRFLRIGAVDEVIVWQTHQ